MAEEQPYVTAKVQYYLVEKPHKTAREFLSEFEKEKREHPTFTDEQIQQIISDHHHSRPQTESHSAMAKRKGGWFGNKLGHHNAAIKGRRSGGMSRKTKLHKHYAKTMSGLGTRHYSKKADGRRSAKHPGWRTSPGGKSRKNPDGLYFENRVNRSDAHPSRKSPWKL